jgi:hypothetical protein
LRRKRKVGFPLPPKRLLQNVGKPRTGGELFGNSAVVGLGVRMEIRFPTNISMATFNMPMWSAPPL